MKRQILLLSSASIIFVAAAFAQGHQADATPAAAGNATHGKELFEANCAACHNSDSEDMKVGPGLKGLSHRKFTVTDEKVTDAEIRRWIVQGSNKMPPIGRAMDPKDVGDIVAYVDTL